MRKIWLWFKDIMSCEFMLTGWILAVIMGVSIAAGIWLMAVMFAAETLIFAMIR